MALDFPSSPTVGQLFPVPAVAGAPVWKWDGAAWVQTSVAGSSSLGAFSQYEYTATASQTTFSGADINSATLAYTVGYLLVFVNGDKINKADYTATNGTSVVFAVGRSAGDQVTIITLTVATVLNALLTTNNLSDLTNVATARTNLGVGQGQILAEPSNGSASSGNVGEFLSATVPIGSAVSTTSATSKDVTSLLLPAGDWDVWGTVVSNPNSSGAVQTQMFAWTSTVSATLPTFPAGGLWGLQCTMTANASAYAGAQMTRYSLSTPTTVYLTGLVTFSPGTNALFGTLNARRRR